MLTVFRVYIIWPYFTNKLDSMNILLLAIL